jgi:hypothetical protein
VKRLAVLCVLGWLGCGGSETPAEKCDNLESDVCDRGVECLPQQTGTHANCVQALDQVLTCSSTKQVGATYDRCIQQIKADSCPTLFQTDPNNGQVNLVLPADCVGVIMKLEPGGPEPATSAIGRSPFQRASQLSTASAE